ncbi:hypothetical protein EXM98_14130 [Clostridium botulinum]|uniref:cytidylyltransferase domain-containing protein n=1 Tax=Clostridium botulinum TaxID=1491 RepID=UPI00096FDE4A|nr:hypothetical protein [Clostridium botulinum]MBY6800475.1 hypothetical protein [Clostridium botulinum]MBY6997804.1 hypothetical protein [Clostridium botulinum]MBY7010061.1 hypothetical protein [Clostridium botulinum]MCC5439069.1 hypothetical protein [Clostridium botulinum]MCR1154642.1 hypothetical protein [Clostridium botulinum]
MNNVIAYIQADIRYNPYLLKEINGKKLIEHTVNRLLKYVEIDKVIMNLYDCEDNQELLYLNNISDKIKVTLSSIENVAERMIESIKKEESNLILRVSGDQFNIEYEFLNQILQEMMEHNYDFFMPYFQDGISSDVVRKQALMSNIDQILKYDRYYKYFIQNSRNFRILNKKHNFTPWKFFVNDDFQLYMADMIINGKIKNLDLNNLVYRIFDRSSDLYKDGWIRSLVECSPVDFKGNALPWLPYSVINLLQERLKEEMIVFEYGSGNSTLWLSKNVSQVYSVEHDLEWFNKVRNMINDNVNYKHIPLEYGGGYSKYILKYTNKFDIVIIDGRDRVNCCKNCINALKDDGIIIWDDTLRDEYNEGYNYLKANGFKELKIKDIGPNRITENQTTIFYRNKNCFGI